MAVHRRNPDLEDPFADFSVLSLLPRTLGAGIHDDAAHSEAQETESFQNLLKSTALRGSSELMEQVQAINKSNSKISTLSSENGDKPLAANGKDHHQGRRPALGRKRAQFSLKSNSSHAVPDVDFSSSIDHIEDPEEYFLAIEQLENADKELKKLRGELSTDLVQHHQSTAARKRRPGIPGKTASYKHHFSAKVNDAEAFMVTQEEIPDIRSSSPSKTSTARESTDILIPEADDRLDTSPSKKTESELLDAPHKEGSIAEKEKNISCLLDNLLFSFEDLDEDEGAVLLRKSLQITSIDVGKVRLPNLPSAQRNDLRALNSRVTGKNLGGTQLPRTSPTVARSSLAAMSTLHQRILLKPPEDPYSEAPSDDSPNSRGSSQNRGRDRHPFSPTVDSSHRDRSDVIVGDDFATVMANDGRLNLEDKMHTSVSEVDRDTVSKITTAEEATHHSSCLPEKTMNHSFSKVDGVKNLFAAPDGDLEQEGNDMRMNDSSSGQPDLEVGDPTSACADCSGSEGLSVPLGSQMACCISGMDIDTTLHVLDGPLQDEVTDIAQEEPVVCSELLKDHSSPSAVVLPMDGLSENICNLPEHNNETEGLQAASGVALNREKIHKASRRKQEKKSRQSLADAGMTWKSGVRRSTRIKSRPLEYWRGERFLYGRIHDSLATVIGLKCSSPGKVGEGQGLKVKSFVSEEYADLVAQAALH